MGEVKKCVERGRDNDTGEGRGRGTQREDVCTEISVSHGTKISGEPQHGL